MDTTDDVIPTSSPIQETEPKSFFQKNKKVLVSVSLATAVVVAFVVLVHPWGAHPDIAPQTTASGIIRATSSLVSQVIDKAQQSIKPHNPSTVIPPKADSLSITPYIPTVVNVECLDDSGEVAQGGSGILYKQGGTFAVATAAHVARTDNNHYDGCWIYIPTSDGQFYDSAYFSQTADLYDNAVYRLADGNEYGGVTYRSGGLDYAQLYLTYPGKDADGNPYPWPLPNTTPNATDIYAAHCQSPGTPIQLGQKIYILGYPASGGDNLTVTDGIVSGFAGDANEYYKTNANIDSGSSGGLALDDRGCSIAMPTLSKLGNISSTGELLSYAFINSTTALLTDSKNIPIDYMSLFSGISADPLDVPPLFPELTFTKDTDDTSGQYWLSANKKLFVENIGTTSAEKIFEMPGDSQQLYTASMTLSPTPVNFFKEPAQSARFFDFYRSVALLRGAKLAQDYSGEYEYLLLKDLGYADAREAEIDAPFSQSSDAKTSSVNYVFAGANTIRQDTVGTTLITDPAECNLDKDVHCKIVGERFVVVIGTSHSLDSIFGKPQNILKALAH